MYVLSMIGFTSYLVYIHKKTTANTLISCLSNTPPPLQYWHLPPPLKVNGLALICLSVLPFNREVPALQRSYR